MTGDGEPFADSERRPGRDPLGAPVEFANLIRERGSVKAGTIVTTRVVDWDGLHEARLYPRKFRPARPSGGSVPRR